MTKKLITVYTHVHVLSHIHVVVYHRHFNLRLKPDRGDIFHDNVQLFRGEEVHPKSEIKSLLYTGVDLSKSLSVCLCLSHCVAYHQFMPILYTIKRLLLSTSATLKLQLLIGTNFSEI